jgi:hypothetical protein
LNKKVELKKSYFNSAFKNDIRELLVLRVRYVVIERCCEVRSRVIERVVVEKILGPALLLVDVQWTQPEMIMQWIPA